MQYAYQPMPGTGIASPAYVPGPYSNREDLLYAFDRFIVEFHEQR